MSAKSGPIILLAAGAAALMMMGGKKKPKKKPIDKLILDAECSKILNRLEFNAADLWITTRAQELISGGLTNATELTVRLLEEQAPHCPWNDESKWTPFMEAIYDQLHEAVKEWSITPEDNNIEEMHA